MERQECGRIRFLDGLVTETGRSLTAEAEARLGEAWSSLLTFAGATLVTLLLVILLIRTVLLTIRGLLREVEASLTALAEHRYDVPILGGDRRRHGPRAKRLP